jgi:large subunit ribosomal protein L4
MAVLSKIIDHQVVIIDGLSVEKPQTSVVASALANIQRPDRNEAGTGTKAEVAKGRLSTATLLFGLPEHDPNLFKSARNIEGVLVAPVSDFNALDILRQRYLVLTREAFQKFKASVEKPVHRRSTTAKEV